MKSSMNWSMNASRLTCTLLLVVAALLLAPLAQAQKFYKWQDESGTWHYDSKPP